MVQRDYIRRQIEQFVAVLAALAGFRRSGAHQTALVAIDEAARRFLGLDATTIDDLSVAELLALMRLHGAGGVDGAPEPETIAILAALLHEQAETEHALHGPDPDRDAARSLKALDLALEAGALLDAAGRDDPRLAATIAATVDAAAARLSGYDLPERTATRLFAHHERAGEYARAEDLLYDLLESGAAQDTIVRQGLDFYRRLLALPDAALRAGNLPRDEVEDGLARMREFRATFEKG